MPPTEERRSARVAGAVAGALALACVALVALQGGAARSFLLFVAPTLAACGAVVALILSLVASKQADRHDALRRGEGRLVEWLVDGEAWRRFRALDAAEATAKVGQVRWAFRLIAALFLLAAAAVYADDSGAWELSVLFIGLGLGMSALGAWLVRSGLAFAARDDLPSPAMIGRDGVSFRGRFVPLRGFGIAFVSATFDETHRILRIRYEIDAGGASSEAEVRVPVPAGREDEAREVADQLRR